ncbi:MAG TPA: ABC transporter ATP-binding protein [Bryobacteraceae bacterium]|jgi:ABC-2 type transport system ATP-binding protein|nr:ABC transporter ATP-binding protein [Bryobacteraceae bacterium]
MPPAIEFRGVTKQYGRRSSGEGVTALADVSFEVEAGEVCGFLGPNGAGKTTCINTLMGFLFADSGEVAVLGYPPGDVRAKRQIGFVPENFAFHPFLTAPKLLRFHAALAGLDDTVAANRIPELIAKAQLCGHEDLRIGKYSRGMVQRLGIAQALLDDPQLLVLDEPTSGLDPAGRRDVREILLSLKSQGKTVFLSTHILSELEQFADRVIIVDRGRLIREGPLAELLDRGGRVAIFVDSVPEEMETILSGRGAVIERGAQGVRVLVDPVLKREAVERLWAAGCDVVSMYPVRSSLEDLFLTLVSDAEKSQ